MKTVFLSEGEAYVQATLRRRLEHQPDFKIGGETGYAKSTLAKVC